MSDMRASFNIHPSPFNNRPNVQKKMNSVTLSLTAHQSLLLIPLRKTKQALPCHIQILLQYTPLKNIKDKNMLKS